MGEDQMVILWGKIEKLLEGLSALDAKVDTHMQNSDNNMRTVRGDISELSQTVNLHVNNEAAALSGVTAEIKKVGDDVKALFTAMPEDEHGRTDLFGHKIDHVDQRADKAERRQTKKSIKDAVIENATRIAIGVALLMFIGEHFTGAVKHMAGG